MFGNPYAERIALEATYEDTAVVTRRSNKKGKDSISRAEWKEIYTGIICGLSVGSDNSRQIDAQHTISFDRTLFVQPDKDIRPGDMVTVFRFGRFMANSPSVEKYEVVGVPMLYQTHREVFLRAVTLA